VATPPNYEIIHILPRSFSVDNQNDIKDPVGMNGVRLEIDALVVEGITPYIKNLTKCISEAGLEKDGMVAVSLAASQSALNKRQKELGVLALDLGGGTANMAVSKKVILFIVVFCQLVLLILQMILLSD